MEIILLAVFAFVLGCILTAVVLVPRFDKNSMERSYQQSAAVLGRSSFNGTVERRMPIEHSTCTTLFGDRFYVSQVKLDDK